MSNIIVILHGWAVDGKKYSELSTILQKKGFLVYVPNLPGFGDEKLKENMDVDAYVEFVKDFLRVNKLAKVILVGHSNGGRIAIKMCYRYPEYVSRLILTGSSGIKPRLSLQKKIAFLFAKIGKALFFIPPLSLLYGFFRKLLYYWIGEWDYYKAGNLRETFKKIISEDLTPYLSSIKVPTLLVWGKYDSSVLLSFGKQMERLIPKAKLVVVPDASHKLPYEDPHLFVKAIMPFLS